jgi:Fic family protein
MNYLILLIIGAAGVWVGYTLARKRRVKAINNQAAEQKSKNMEKVRALARERGKIANDDVEKLLGVSNATAERYLNELEKNGELKQVGTTGRNVYYEIIR